MIPTKEDIQKLISKELKPQEELINFFGARTPFKIWLAFLLGPLFVVFVRSYLVGVTDKGIHFLRLKTNFFSTRLNVAQHDFFSYEEINRIKVGRGIVFASVKFFFKNKKKLKLKCQVGGMKHIPKLDSTGKQYLVSLGKAA